MPHDFRAGDKLLFNHAGGEIPAEVIETRETSPMIRVTIHGWLGRHWYPAASFSHTRKGQAA